jgi:hypothetical protein
MTIRRIDRTAADGTTLTITFGRHQIPVQSISYGDKIETQQGSNTGSQKIDWETPGSYSTEEAACKMEAILFRELMTPLMASDGISADTFSIVVTDSHPGFGDDSDLLEGAHFVGLKAARDNSNNAAMVEFGIKFKQIYWTNSRITINRRDMRKPIASSQF